MPGILTFNVGVVRKLLDHAQSTKKHKPSYDQIFEAKYHKGGKIRKDRYGFPDQDSVDQTKIPAALWLVADRGIYLMSNGAPGLLQEGSKQHYVVAYARECDPDKMPDWYLVKERIMGGDDTVIALPLEMLAPLLEGKEDSDTFRLKASAKNIRGLL